METDNTRKYHSFASLTFCEGILPVSNAENVSKSCYVLGKLNFTQLFCITIMFRCYWRQQVGMILVYVHMDILNAGRI